MSEPSDAAPRIVITPYPERLRVQAGDTLIAESDDALRLEEKGYPPRCYIAAADLHGAELVVSDHRTHCPYKGDATYYHLDIATADGATRRLDNAAWCYREPIEAVALIAGRIAFDHAELRID